jgi:hypothetical protein
MARWLGAQNPRIEFQNLLAGYIDGAPVGEIRIALDGKSKLSRWYFGESGDWIRRQEAIQRAGTSA